MTWTNEQEAAIVFPLDKNQNKLPADNKSAVVTAAAGSGKTALLVERVIRILCDTKHPIPADQIAVMTFTNNAADEFRHRMTQAVAEAAKKDPKNTYLADQLIRFRSATIKTISSFSYGIVRENAEAFGLPLSVTIADDAKVTLLRSAALDSTMEHFYSSDFDPDKRELLFKTFSFKNDDLLSETIGDIYNKISSLTDPLLWLNEAADRYSSVEKAEKHFTAYYIPTIQRYVECIRSYFLKFKSIIDALPEDHEDRKKLLGMLADDEYRYSFAAKGIKQLGAAPTIDKLFEYASKIGTGAGGNTKFATLSVKDKSLKERISKPRDKFKSYFKKIKEFVPDKKLVESELPTQLDAVSSLTELIRYYSEDYTTQKRDAGLIDYADCERLLLDKLREDSAFCRRIGERYRCIIIDEFQDTNDIQYEIFRLISNRENNLFFVGDIKQAIYAFRGGNPRIMLRLCDPTVTQKLLPLPADVLPALRSKHKSDKLKLPTARKLKSGCCVFNLGAKFTALPLNKNFRSRQQVIDTVNAMFTGLMTKDYGDVDYNDSTKLFCGATYPSSTEDYISELHLLDYEAEKDKDAAEARYTAHLVNKMLTEKFAVRNSDDSTRPCTYGDFAILLRSSGSFPLFKKELEKYGIPVNSGSQKSYLASEEITLILNYLKVIDNPMRDEELLHVLTSPIYMMTAEELAQARLGILGADSEAAKNSDLTPLYEYYKKSSLYACISACAKPTNDKFGKQLSALRKEGHPKCVKFIQTLKNLRAFKSNNSIERLIRRLYDDTDFFSVISTYERNGQQLANIRLLLKYAADFENSGGGTLSDFLRYTDHVRSSGDSFEEAMTADSADNAVRIMTFHKSKGLEMPIVILAELGKQPNNKDSGGAVVFNSEAGIGLRYVDIKARYQYKPFGYNAVSMAQAQKQKGEELRLLYVAMTRAREKLIMIGKCTAEGANSLHTDVFTPDFAMANSTRLSWILASLLRYSNGRTITDSPLRLTNDVLSVKVTSEVPPEPSAQTAAPKKQSGIADMFTAHEIAHNISLQYQHEQLTHSRSKFTVTEIAHMIDDKAKTDSSEYSMTFVGKPEFLPNGVLSGKEVGDAYHHVMEHFPLNDVLAGKTADIAMCTAVLDSLRARDILSEAEYKVVSAEHIARFFTSRLGQRMLKSPRIEREFPIFAEVPACDIMLDQPGNTIIQGRADMFFVEDGKIVLVDYKSDSAKSLEAELDAYIRQLSIYRTVLPIVTGLEVEEIYLYSFSGDKEIPVE